MRVLSLALALSSAAAFAPQQTAARSTALFGYVPDGITEAEYLAGKAKVAKAAEEKKKKFPKNKAYLGVGKWLEDMEKAQTFTGATFGASGHTYAKQKFATKEEFDKAKGRK